MCQHYLSFTLLLLTPLFFAGGPDYSSDRSLVELWNLGHLFFFYLFGIFWFRSRWLVGMSVWHRAAAGLSLTLVIGGAIELMQLGEPHRVASLADLLRDISGFMISLFQVLFKESWPVFYRVLWIFCGFDILAINLFSFGLVLADEIRAEVQFPMLADFETAGELGRWGKGAILFRDQTVARTGNFSARLELTTEKYSGVSLNYFHRNWRGYNCLKMSVYNPGPVLVLHIRVHDKQHRSNQNYGDRFNRRFHINYGWNDISLALDDIEKGPESRNLDLANVEALGIFVMEQVAERVIYLDSLRLD